ncbi:MAG TPA: glycosyltransferase family 1 protein, partial [Telluria sp.]
GRMRERIGAATRIVTISHFVAEDVVRHFPEAAGKISVIYCGTNFTRAPAGHRPQYEPRQPFLFTIGMVCEKKNFHVLVPLLQGNAMQLVIAGIVKEGYRDRIMAAAREHGVAERVIITGPVSTHDKNWYYAHCHAFLFPSLAEGFGLPVLEAMHHGKPVFLSTSTSLPEVGGDAAYYFENFEPASMRAALAAGLADFAVSGGAARARARAAGFTWENAARDYLALYRALLAPRLSPGAATV